MSITLRDLLASHGIKPNALLDAPIGEGMNDAGVAVSAHMVFEHPGGVGVCEVNVALRSLAGIESTEPLKKAA